MYAFSSSALSMRSSEIRRLMKLAADPSIVSFAGGMPNNSLFPCDVVEELYHNLTLQEKQNAFQYGPTTGYPPLVAELKEYLRSRGLPVDTNDLLITTGAQQAISILAKIFIDPGDTIITEYPCFIGAVAAFQSHAASMKSIALDDEGIIINDLEHALEQTSPKMVYLSPYFHNPAGIVYSESRKQAVLELCDRYDTILLEDDPYGELYFDTNDRELTRPMKAMSNDASRICYVGSFAKILGPGMRLGYLLAPKAIIEKSELAKQSMDACSSTFTQVLAHAFLAQKKLVPYLEMLRPVYNRRAQTMLNALREYMPEQITWTTPRGGFYIWVSMPEHIDASEVFAKSLEHGAAFVIGNAFDPAGKRNNCFRLAFSHTPEEKIAEGVRIIADAVKTFLK